ncbi:unnamed protein product [Cuscuta epithymum]|uniref:Mitogen-activated protein kinase kinase kinase 1 n=1 Tax=Cuscuta epithymum TaxID=186058 RepID=A0AAV0DNY2_9ASTE|nr:unnamed protein product [Cuscuta epithymum]
MDCGASSSTAAEPSSNDYIAAAPTQALADRIIRALRHPLRLLHRSDALFFVLGATANVYTVNLGGATIHCTCPDPTAPCKHILFVMIRVLGLELHDPCIWRKSLPPQQLNRLLGLPTSADAVAGTKLREKFHQLFSRERLRHPVMVIPEGAACPVCLEEIEREERRVAACGTCKNPIHEECLQAWRKQSKPRRSFSCVLCRARWRDVRAANPGLYLNLSNYVS